MAALRVILVVNQEISYNTAIFTKKNIYSPNPYRLVDILMQVKRDALQPAGYNIFFRKVGKYPDQDLEPCLTCF